MAAKHLFALALSFAVLLGACSREADKDAHGHDEASIAVTHYTPQTELFVEFPALVRGVDAEFVAHLTRLSDFKPVGEGTLKVMLSGGGQPEESGESLVSDTAGIFRPLLAPQHAGKRNLSFLLSAPGLEVKHEVGEVQVHVDEKAAAAAAGNAADTGIRYTKEQQWRVDFAVAPAAERRVRESVALTALIRPRAAGEARVTAPGPGLLRAASGVPQVGSRVSAGQVLGYLLPRLGAETDIATLELAVSKAKLDAALAAQELERLEKLLQAEAVAEKRVQEARHRSRIAAAELAAAQRRVAAYQGGAGGGIALKSPIAGTVVAVGGQAGSAFEQGQTIFHVADLERLWLEAQVPESDLGRIAKPAGAFFRLDGDERAIVLEVGKNARLVAFGGLVNPETRTVPAILEFDNPGGRLKAGMQVRAGLYTGRVAQGVTVPAGAIVDDSGQPVAFVQKGGESFERRLVTLGPRDGDWIAVTSGLAPDERVVTRGAWQVRLAASAPAQAGHGHAH